MSRKTKREEADEESVVELPEQSRREFITKLVATAGAVAVAGVMAEGQSAEADIGKIEYVKDVKDVVTFRFGKVRSGFRLSMSGRQLGTALRDIGLLAETANLDNATMTIEFTA